jgi:hypothetical protein
MLPSYSWRLPYAINLEISFEGILSYLILLGSTLPSNLLNTQI